MYNIWDNLFSDKATCGKKIKKIDCKVCCLYLTYHDYAFWIWDYCTSLNFKEFTYREEDLKNRKKGNFEWNFKSLW